MVDIPQEQIDFIAKLYAEQPLPTSMLPYTPELEQMLYMFLVEFRNRGSWDSEWDDSEKRDFWRLLERLRKAGLLPNKTTRKTTKTERKRNQAKAKKYGGFFS